MSPDRRSTAKPSAHPASPAITFRQATPADREATLAISARFTNDWIAYAFDQTVGEGKFFVAEEAGQVIAVCGYDDLGDTAWLQAMRVHPDYHRRGVATAFTLYLMDRCRELGFRRVRLDTQLKNDPVHHMMAKLGFRRLGDISLAWFPYQDGLLAVPVGGAPATGLASGATPAGALQGTTVRPADSADVEAIWAFLERRAAESKLHPFRLGSKPGSVFQIGDLDERRMAEWVAEGDVLVAEGAALVAVEDALAPEAAGRGVVSRGQSAARNLGGSGSIAGVAVWKRFVEPPAEGPDEEGYEHTDIVYLEGEPAVAAALFAAVIEADSHESPAKFLNFGLPMSQWRNLMPLLDPDKAPKEEDLFQATVYEKDCEAGGTGGAHGVAPLTRNGATTG